MRKYIPFLIVVLIASGCTSASKLRKAEKLIKQAEAMGATWHSDTVYQTITVTNPSVRVDTVIKQVDFSDTITLVKDKVITKVKVNTITKQVYIATKCPETKQIVRVPYKVTREIKAKQTIKWWWILIALGAGFITGQIFGANVSFKKR